MSWILYSIFLVSMLLLIMRGRFFQLPGLHRAFPLLFFLIKIIASFAVWWIYTVHYPDRKTADIWKYFDDGNIMYSALHEHSPDYGRMLIGIDDDSPSVLKYYHQMDHWYQQFDNHLLNDAHFMIRVNAVLRTFSLGNYHIHSLFLCFLAFIGLCALYKALFEFLRQWKLILAGIIFLFPSLVFWTSGVLKETIMIFALGIFILQLILFLQDKKLIRFLWITLASLLLFLTKFYLLAVLIPSSIALAWAWKRTKAVLKYAVVFILALCTGLCVKFISPDHDPLKVLALKQRDFVNVAHGGTRLYNDSVVVFIKGNPGEHVTVWNDPYFTTQMYTINEGTDYMYWYHYPDFSDTVFVTNSHDHATYKLLNQQIPAGSLMETKILEPSIPSFLAATPSAFAHSLFRPFIRESKDLLMIVPALENLLLLLFIVLAAFHRKRPENLSVSIFLIAFSMILLWLMGITTPVLGALVRYRIAAFPFLLMALLMFIDKERIFMGRPDTGDPKAGRNS